MRDETIDVGYVHTLTAPGGPCREDCPHPDHSPETAHPDEDWFRLTEGEVADLSAAIFTPAADRLIATRRAVEAIIRVRGDLRLPPGGTS